MINNFFLSRFGHIATIASRLARKRAFALLGGLNKGLQPRECYAIKKGYHHATSAEAFDDTNNKDEWQKEVYQLALHCMRQQDHRSVIDVGCGSAYKLVHMLGAYQTTGIEVNPTYNWLRQTYPGKNWLLFDEVDPSSLQTDLVLCADVIEHIDDPDGLMQFLQSIHCRQLLISTPERDAVAGKSDYGPPANTSHYREWNAAEFREYVSRYFIVEEQIVLPGLSVTQVIICRKKSH
ncbi:MAG TPA: methyltransferase domain-containing protein [Chitinophagaceae bacterium]|nr:methyltransferase domain-containing protein [Chitinophagaceae bacterium]